MSDEPSTQPAVSQYVPPVDNTFGWAISAGPVVTLLLAVILARASGGSAIVMVVMVALNTWLAVADRKRMVAAGYAGVSPFWGFLVMPVYVVMRGRQTGSWAIPLAYGFALLLYVAVAVSVA